MRIFSAFKYFDLGYLYKKADLKNKTQQVVPVAKDLLKKLSKEFDSSREKLKDIPGTNYQLGLRHMYRGNVNDAIMRFRMVTFLTPENAEAYYNLGRCLVMAGDNDNARKNFDKTLQMKKSHADTNYQLQKLDDPESIKIIPTAIIKEWSNVRADFYDSDYLGGKLLVNLALANINDKNPNLDVLDLGCGTGECGKILREKEVAKKITGVDITHKVLTKAKARKMHGTTVYDSTEDVEISEFLSKNKEKFDLILADMSFEFFGDWSNILSDVKKSLKARGIFAFTISKSDIKSGYKLNVETDDFFHSEEYIKDALKKTGLKELQVKDFDISGAEEGFIFVCGI